MLKMNVIVYCNGVFLCSYVEKYDLHEPSDDIHHVLKRIAVKLRKTQRVKAITGVGKNRHCCYMQYYWWTVSLHSQDLNSCKIKQLLCLYGIIQQITCQLIAVNCLFHILLR